MKKTLIVVFMLVFALAMVLVACEGEETETTEGGDSKRPRPVTETSVYEPGTFNYTFNTFFPATNNIAIVGEMWQAEITERTNGAVTFEYLPGASLTAAKDVYDGVVTGISDLGLLLRGLHAGRLPHHRAAGLCPSATRWGTCPLWWSTTSTTNSSRPSSMMCRSWPGMAQDRRSS